MKLIIGNSFIGSLLAFCKEKNINTIDFCGNGGSGFSNIGFDNFLSGFNFSYGDIDSSLNKYSSVYIYADCPSPIVIAKELNIDKKFYSSGFLLDYVRDRIDSTSAGILYKKISASYNGSVFLVCRNVRYDTILPDKNNVNKIFTKMLDVNPNIKGATFSLLYEVSDSVALYKNSVYLGGREADQNGHPNHDFIHMNSLGGCYILSSLGLID